METYGEVEFPFQGGEFFHSRHKTAGRYRYSSGGEFELINQSIEGDGEVVKIEQTFTDAHKNEIVRTSCPEGADAEFLKHFPGTQVAGQTISAGSTEKTSDRTADLSTQAKGQSFFAGDGDHLDIFVVMEFEEEFLHLIRGGGYIGDA